MAALKYAVIADGSLRIAHQKGEVKLRYWNPCDLFDEVHVLTLADDDIGPELVQQVAGRGKLFVYPVGRPRPHNLLKLRRRVLDTMVQIAPDVVRGHGPFLQGYYAVWAAQRLGVPSFISIHDDISIYRRFWTYGRGYAKITAYQLLLTALGWTRYTYAHADRIVAKYQAAGRLLRRSRYRDKLEVIYNAINLDTFTDLQPRLRPGERLRVINVGRQFAGKDQRPLIRALRHVDAELTLIGQGPLRPALEATARQAGVTDRVQFVDAVANERLPEAFAGHHVFAINILQPGVCMPVMEAMALGFPIVINRPRWEPPEVCATCARIVPATEAGYAAALNEFLADTEQVARMGTASRQTILQYSGAAMERAERDLLVSLFPGLRERVTAEPPAAARSTAGSQPARWPSTSPQDG